MELSITPTLYMKIESVDSNGCWVSFHNKEGFKMTAFVDPLSKKISSISSKDSLDNISFLISLVKNNEEEVYQSLESNKHELERLRRFSNLQNL